MVPFAFPIVVYLACGGLLWLVAYILAPIGYEVSLWRGVGAVLLMGLAGAFSTALLKPAFGNWHIVGELVASIFIVHLVLRLPMSRSFAAVLIYWIVLGTAAWFLVIKPQKSHRAEIQDAGVTATAVIA